MQVSPYMKRAIELAAKAGLGERSGGCFGAVIVKNGEIVGEGYNQVLGKNDPTWHAEMQAIRDASRYLGTHILDDCTLYTSGEPCPMCMCASGWARIPRIVYGSTVDDAKEYGNFDDKKFYSDMIGGRITHVELDPNARIIMEEVWKEYQNSKPIQY